MIAAERNRHRPQHDGYPRPAAESGVDSPPWRRVSNRRQVITEVVTVLLCGPPALITLVLVAFHGWPPWLLVVAGMLIAWTGDGLWTLGEHAVRVATTRRTATAEQPRRALTSQPPTPGGVLHTCRREPARWAEDQR